MSGVKDSFIFFQFFFIISFFVSLLSGRLFIFLGNYLKIVDTPDHRKIHKEVTPRWGGGAIYLTSWLLYFILFPNLDEIEISLFLGSTLLVIAGSIDDRWGLKPSVKLAIHILAAVLFVSISGIKINLLNLPLTGMVKFPSFVGYILAIGWIVLLINAFNLIDGVDGLAGGLALLALLGLIFLSSNFKILVLSTILSGAIMGFLFYNYPPALEFMGDTGSMFIGFMIGSITLFAGTKTFSFLSIFVPLLLVLIPVLDTTWAFIRRVANKQPPFQPDNMHIHHRLLKLNLEKREVLVILLFISAVIGITTIFLSFSKSIVTIFSAGILFSSGIIILLILADYFQFSKLISDMREALEKVNERGKTKKKPLLLELTVNILIVGYYLNLIINSYAAFPEIIYVDAVFLVVILYSIFLSKLYKRKFNALLLLLGILLLGNYLVYLAVVPEFNLFTAKKNVILLIIAGYLIYETFFLYYYNIFLPYPEDVIFTFILITTSITVSHNTPSWWTIPVVVGIMYFAVKLLLIKMEEWGINHLNS